MDERRFPCLDGHLYSGCMGPAKCPAERCWNGRRLRLSATEVRADAFDRPLKVLRYTASDCPNCAHAVDLRPDCEMRSPGGRLIKRWTICELGLWAGPASLYNLLNHRAPVKRIGHCPSFAERPAEQMRPELVRQREADRIRAAKRRERLRHAQAGATSGR
jgi:hypothetical protein